MKLIWTGLQVIMIRRLKAEVMAQLPPKRRQVVRLPKPRPQDWPKLGAHSVPRPRLWYTNP